MICIARTFGAPDSVPGGQHRAQRVHRADASRSVPGDRRDDVHDVRVGLDRHERVDGDGAVLAHAAEVVAPEVDEHHVLGALLLVGEQARRRSRASSAASAPRGRVPAIGRVETWRPVTVSSGSGAGAGDLEVLEVQEVHVRARVDDAQAAVDRERVDVDLAPTSAATGTTWKASPAWTYSTIRATIASNCSRGHVRLERRHGARRGRVSGRGTGPASSPRAFAIVASASRVGGLEVGAVLGVDVDEDRDRVLEVVEDHEHVGEHQRHVRQPERSGFGSPSGSTVRTRS